MFRPNWLRISTPSCSVCSSKFAQNVRPDFSQNVYPESCSECPSEVLQNFGPELSRISAVDSQFRQTVGNGEYGSAASISASNLGRLVSDQTPRSGIAQTFTNTIIMGVS